MLMFKQNGMISPMENHDIFQNIRVSLRGRYGGPWAVRLGPFESVRLEKHAANAVAVIAAALSEPDYEVEERVQTVAIGGLVLAQPAEVICSGLKCLYSFATNKKFHQNARAGFGRDLRRNRRVNIQVIRCKMLVLSNWRPIIERRRVNVYLAEDLI